MHHLRSLSLSSSADVILITESWCTTEHSNAYLHIQGYSLYRAHRSSRRGGGCLAYIKSAYTVLPVPSLSDLEDTLWLCLPDVDLLIGCLYIAPSCSYDTQDDIVNLIHLASSHPTHRKIIAGDFNMPDVDWNRPLNPSRYLPFSSTMHSLGYSQLVSTPTRGSHILDLIFTLNLAPSDVCTLPPLAGSDHRIVSTTITLPDTTMTSSTPSSSFKQHVDWSTFSHHIRSIDWSTFFLTADPEFATHSLHLNLLNAQAYSSVIMKRKSRNTRLVKLERKITKLTSRYESSRSFYLLYRLLSLNDTYHSLRQASLIKEEANALSDTKQPQSLLRLFRKRFPPQSDSISFITGPTGERIDTPSMLSESFLSYFASTFNATTFNLPPNVQVSISCPIGHLVIDPHTITRLISQLKTSYKQDQTGIATAYLKLGGPDIPLLLLNIFNLSLRSGIFPSCWKMSLIMPCHKGGDRHSLSNYRPIHKTPIISRIFERAIKIKLLERLPQDFFSQSQHGFLNRKSCSTCQLEFLDFVTAASDKKLSVVTIYLDMRKAFDRVPHNLLLHKLHHVGIRDSLLGWFESYLLDRQMSVLCNGALSRPTPIVSGVIQGSVLGPLLFLLYINELPSLMQYGKAFMFADDIKLVFTNEPGNDSDLIRAINSDLSILCSWCDDWGMEFSAPKSCALIHRCKLPEGSICLGKVPLRIADSVVDLGTRYDATLTFKEQASYLYCKARRLCAMISQSFFTPNARISLYKSIVRPSLEYCSIIHSHLSQFDRARLERAQRSFTKSFPNISTLTYRQRSSHLNLDPLWLRRVKLNLIFFFKYYISTNRLPRGASSSCSLRNSSNLVHFQVPKSSLRKRFFFIRYASLWNHLPSKIRACGNHIMLKKALTQFLTADVLRSLSAPYTAIDKLFEDGLPHT